MSDGRHQVQAFGAVIVADAASGAIQYVSENSADATGIAPNRLVNGNLSDIRDNLHGRLLHDVPSEEHQRTAVEIEFENNGSHFDLVAYRDEQRFVLEFLPNPDPSIAVAKKRLRDCSVACADVLRAEQWDDALQVAANAVAAIAGFSGALVMQFNYDGSGEVVAEALIGDDVPSCLGRQFAEMEFPLEDRQRIKSVGYKVVGGLDDDRNVALFGREDALPFDPSWSVLQTATPSTTAFLRKLGAEASFTCRLMFGGELWGSIYLHNHQPAFVPFDCWSLIDQIGAALMLRYVEKQRAEAAGMIEELRRIESGFASELRRSGNIRNVLSGLAPRLQGFLNADGFAFLYGADVYTSGNTPPEECLRRLSNWISGEEREGDFFQTVSLGDVWEEARHDPALAFGVLAQPSRAHRICQLIWFREPIEQGEGQSQPWRDVDLMNAREIYLELLDIIASQVLLREENATLRNFTSTAAHDLKAPIRSINMALKWMREDGFTADVVKETHALATASARRMSDLLDKLVELAFIDDQDHDFDRVDLQEVLADVQVMMAPQLLDAGAEVDVGPMLAVEGNRHLLVRLFLNLISNCLKYRHPERAPRIQITCRAKMGNKIEVSVTDNGNGIPIELSKRIFVPMERLVSKDEIEGTGLGLTICGRIAAVHNGSIQLDESYQGGARFVVELPLNQNPPG